MRKNNFTLLEVLLALALLAIVGTLVGVRASQSIQAMAFQSSILELRHQIQSTRQMACNTQADWWVEVNIDSHRMNVRVSCPEMGRSTQWERKAPFQLYWKGEAVQKMTFFFSASGKIVPDGLLEFRGKKKNIEWHLPEIFHVTEGHSCS